MKASRPRSGRLDALQPGCIPRALVWQAAQGLLLAAALTLDCSPDSPGPSSGDLGGAAGYARPDDAGESSGTGGNAPVARSAGAAGDAAVGGAAGGGTATGGVPSLTNGGASAEAGAGGGAPESTPCERAEARLGKPVCVHRVADPVTWAEISISGGAEALWVTKYLVPARDDARLPTLFMDAHAYPLHYDFLVEAFGELFAGMSRDQYLYLILNSTGREMFAGLVLEYANMLHEAIAKDRIPIWCTRGTYLSAPYLSPDLMARAEKIFQQAEAAVRDDPELLRRVEVDHIPVQYVVLKRADQLWEPVR